MTIKNFGSHTKIEILSQPEVWMKALNNWSEINFDNFPNFKDYQQVLYIGCGSTFFLSRWIARLGEAISGVACRAAPSSELLLHPKYWLREDQKTLLVASSRSAATTETINAIEIFQEKFLGDTVIITCNPEETMGNQSQYVVAAHHAKENSIAQTRSFSSMMLAHAAVLEKGISDSTAHRLKECGVNLITKYLDQITRFAHDQSIQRFFFLGSGPLYGIANECMLKMKEISLCYSESFHSMEFRHGPMSMVDKNTLVISLLGNDDNEQELSVLREMKDKGAQTIALIDTEPDLTDGIDEFIIFNSNLPLLWRSVLYLPPMQWLAYERGVQKGLDPDCPNNLEAVVKLEVR